MPAGTRRLPAPPGKWGREGRPGGVCSLRQASEQLGGQAERTWRVRRDLRLRSPRVGGQGRHVNRAAHRETAVNGPEGARGTGEVETKCPAAVYCQKRHRCQEPVANSKSQEESEGTRLSHRGRTLCFFCICINVQAYVYASQLDFYYSSFKVFYLFSILLLPLCCFS